MCYNCGCELPDDDMGVGNALSEQEGKSITNETFIKLAENWEMTPDEAKLLTLQILKGEKKDEVKETFLEPIYDDAAKSQGMTIEEAKDETRKLLEQVLS